jgi:SAM-dependent methyltransferase
LILLRRPWVTEKTTPGQIFVTTFHDALWELFENGVKNPIQTRERNGVWRMAIKSQGVADLGCPVCGGAETTLVYEADVPMQHLLPAESPGPAGDLPRIEIVSCLECGHLFNRLFDGELAARTYSRSPVTNVPVHPSMMERLSDLYSWLGDRDFNRRHVLEVGSGSGHLARLFAAAGARVTVFEPSHGLTPAMLPETGITLIPSLYPGSGEHVPADLIICRQVLEHLANPAEVLACFARDLTAGGALYLEVPDAAYVTEKAAVQDLHAQHVQYFDEAHLIALAGRAGFEAVRTKAIKDGHDIGILFRRADGDPWAGIDLIAGYDVNRVRRDLLTRVQSLRDAMGNLAGRTCLYGATMQASVFLCLLDGIGDVSEVLDDNPRNLGCVLEGGVRRAAIITPEPGRLTGYDTIVITAYLHDIAIAERLRDDGFVGDIVTTRPGTVEDNAFDLNPLLRFE